MGFPLFDQQKQSKQHSINRNLQKYYSETFRQTSQRTQNLTFSSKQVLASIFTRTKAPTNTFHSRELALLDIDKLISFSSGSLKQQSQNVKYMRMVAGLMQESERNSNSPTRQMQQLVRIARLHYMSNQRRRGREQMNQQERQVAIEQNAPMI